MGQLISRTFSSSPPEKRLLLLSPPNCGLRSLIDRLLLDANPSYIPTIGFGVPQFYLDERNLSLVFWEMDEQTLKVKSLWHHYYEGAGAIVFVVKTKDAVVAPAAAVVVDQGSVENKENSEEEVKSDQLADVVAATPAATLSVEEQNAQFWIHSRLQLELLLTEPLLQSKPLLVLAHDQSSDSSSSSSSSAADAQTLTLSDITERLNLNSITNRPWTILTAHAKSEGGDQLYEGLDWIAKEMKTIEQKKKS